MCPPPYKKADGEPFASQSWVDYNQPYDDLQRGGFVDRTGIADCVQESSSKWKQEGSWGFVLHCSRPIPFYPWKGKLQFFNVPNDVFSGAEHRPAHEKKERAAP